MIHTLSRGYRAVTTTIATLAIHIMITSVAHASGASMPWVSFGLQY